MKKSENMPVSLSSGLVTGAASSNNNAALHLQKKECNKYDVTDCCSLFLA
jgi:hypothetical protein